MKLLQRIPQLLVVVFFLTMTGLLIHKEYIGSGAFLDVPPEHVLTLMLRHEQVSSLIVEKGDDQIGTLELIPSRQIEPDGSHSYILRTSGNIGFKLPGNPNQGQRLQWTSSSSITKDHEFGSQEWIFMTRSPAVRTKESEKSDSSESPPRSPEIRLEVSFDIQKDDYQFVFSQNNEILRDQSGRISEIGNLPEIQQLGINFKSVLKTVGQARPEIKAHRSKLKIRDEEIEVYHLRVLQMGEMVAEIYINQIGQILLLKSSTGYSLRTHENLHTLPNHD